MIKTEIIGFCQKINRKNKLVELSDTLTQKRCRRHGRCGRVCNFREIIATLMTQGLV